jgi:integrase
MPRAGPDHRRPTCAQPRGFLVPFFALALFAGIRPDWKHGEISKITPRAIDLATGVIRIEPAVSKTNEKRVIAIQPNLRLWLQRYPLEEFPPIPAKNIDRVLREVRQKFSLGHDVLRHTYIYMTVGAFRSVGDAALQAGNSETVIRRHYLDLKTVAEADAFWRITPDGTKLPEKFEKKDGRYVPPAVSKTKERSPKTGEGVATVES